MKENLIEPERIRAIQEALCGFLLDEVINPKGEFYSDQRISAWLELNERNAATMMTKTTMIRIIYKFVRKNLTYEYSYL